MGFALSMKRKAVRKTATVMILIALGIVLYGLGLEFTGSSDPTVPLLTGCSLIVFGLAVRWGAATFLK